MNQKQFLILLGVVILVGVLVLFTNANYHYFGGGIPDDEMLEHMHDDSDHLHDDDDGHMHDETGEHMHDEDELDTPTSADNAPEGSIHNLPVPEAVAAVREHVADELGISEGVVIVMSAYEREWPNGCLGLSGPDELCTQAIVSGYEVTVQAQGKLHVYRTNGDGSVLREE